MKQGENENENDDDDENHNDDENEKEDMKNILLTLKSPIESKMQGKKTRGYFTTKNNIKKPLTYFKICNFCGKQANLCECLQILNGQTNFKKDQMIIEETDMNNNNEDLKYMETYHIYKYQKKAPSIKEVFQNLKESKIFSVYQ